jgi:predicted amidophosphoribosyltransferase
MSATAQRAAEHSSPEPTRTCPACGAELADDQEWCLECGTATTVIHSSPDWWVPVVVIVIVVALALAGFIYALSRV